MEIIVIYIYLSSKFNIKRYSIFNQTKYFVSYIIIVNKWIEQRFAKTPKLALQQRYKILLLKRNRQETVLAIGYKRRHLLQYSQHYKQCQNNENFRVCNGCIGILELHQVSRYPECYHRFEEVFFLLAHLKALWAIRLNSPQPVLHLSSSPSSSSHSQPTYQLSVLIISFYLRQFLFCYFDSVLSSYKTYFLPPSSFAVLEKHSLPLIRSTFNQTTEPLEDISTDVYR